MKKFSANLINTKHAASSIINNLKTIFSTVFGAIGKVVRAAANVIAAIFGKKISSTCSTAKAVLQALKIVVGVVFGAIATLIKKNMAVIVPDCKSSFFRQIKGAISGSSKHNNLPHKRSINNIRRLDNVYFGRIYRKLA